VADRADGLDAGADDYPPYGTTWAGDFAAVVKDAVSFEG
jgi:hypothetical protein